MALKGTDETLRKVADDEPIFVLRARDKTAPYLVCEWVKWQRRNNTHISQAKLDEAMALARAMDDWQLAHGSKWAD